MFQQWDHCYVSNLWHKPATVSCCLQDLLPEIIAALETTPAFMILQLLQPSDGLCIFNYRGAHEAIQIPGDSQCSPEQHPEIWLYFFFPEDPNVRCTDQSEATCSAPLCWQIKQHRNTKESLGYSFIMCNMKATDWASSLHLHACAYTINLHALR